jgi:hypothetical protein
MPDFSQNFNRYSYCLNNPLRYTDPSGNVFGVDDAIFWGVVALSAYIGGSASNNGQLNPIKWDWQSGQTYVGVIGGGIVGAATFGVGSAFAAAKIPWTLNLIVTSTYNSVGMYAVTGGRTPITTSFGIGSYNWTTGEFGYLGKKGNRWYENVGYGIGALANLSDAITLADRFLGVENKIAARANGKISEYEAQGHTMDKISLDQFNNNLNGTSYMGGRNPQFGPNDYYYGRVPKWGYKEYASYLHDVDYVSMGFDKGASAFLLSAQTLSADVSLFARQLFLSAKHFDVGGMLFGIGMTGISAYKSPLWLLYQGFPIP